jgi:hypothetical protein
VGFGRLAKRRITCCALGLAFGAGCGGRTASQAEPALRAPRIETARPQPSATRPGPEESEASIDQVVARALEVVSRARQLPEHGPVRGRVATRAEMLAAVRQQLDDELPPGVVEAQEELLFGLNLVPADFDYLESVFSLMAEQLAGLYDPKTKTMLLANDLGDTERWATLAHELVHALQDQHYELGPRMKHRAGGGDEQSALQTLAEGDATSAMLDLLGGRAATELDDRTLSLEMRGLVALGGTSGVPDILRRSLVAPYADGVVLVNGLRRRGGWAAVDDLWRRPPTSTEQVLHPDKLASREMPEAVPVPAAPSDAGWQLLDADVMGEQGVRLVFEEWMPRRKATDSAADWAGDQMAAYRRGDEHAVAWGVRYDTTRAAERGVVAFARGVLHAAQGEGASDQNSEGMIPEADARRAAIPGHVCRERTLRGPFAVVRDGRSVMVVAGPYRRESSPAKAPPRAAADCVFALGWAKRALRATPPRAELAHPTAKPK